MKSGFRFSKNAENASFASGATSMRRNTSPSSAIFFSTAATSPPFISRLVSRSDEAGNAASLRACCSANACSSATGSTRVTSPSWWASCAPKGSPSISFSAARW
ncbi:hypothetical protein AWV80_13005 [Cupriavidus sp. UYMU48A]|nr:hypothetical protein AWV80_13005 [Cupriavidus sp. UYMU48A]